MPTFSPDVLAVDRARRRLGDCHMRGGAEYGEAWHKAGNLEKKQNVFDDFIAVAEELMRQKYTSLETGHHGRIERRTAGRRRRRATA